MSSLIENQNKIQALEAEIVELKAEIVVFKAELRLSGVPELDILNALREMTRQLNLLMERRERLEQQTSAAAAVPSAEGVHPVLVRFMVEQERFMVGQERFMVDQESVNKRILENTECKKTKHQFAASKISSEVRERHFKCAQVDLQKELAVEMKSYGDPVKAGIFLDEVCRYSRVMEEHLQKGERDEKQFVQEEITKQFWPAVMQCLRNSASVELINERQYIITVEDEDDRTVVRGKTDHAVKIKTCDFYPLTIEDKGINLKMTAHEIGQAKTEIINEVAAMESGILYIPEDYCAYS